MAALICSKCGAEFEPPARFCRRCGNSLGAGEPSISPSEATTRAFEHPGEHAPAEANRTAPANQWPTAPAYLAPDQTAVGRQYPVFPGADTQGLTQKRSKAPIVVVALILFFLFVVTPALCLLMYQILYRGPAPNHTPVADNIPPPPPPPGLPGHPEVPVPPAPPAPPEGPNAATATTFTSLIYPGSEQSVNVHSEGEGTIIMSTSDPSSKVVDWYVARLPDAKVVSIPFTGGAVITKGKTAVTITPGSPATMIVLAVEKKRN